MLTAEQTTTEKALNTATVFTVNYKTAEEIPNKESIAKAIKSDIDKGIYKQFPKLKTKLTAIVATLLLSDNKSKSASFDDFLTLAENEYI